MASIYNISSNAAKITSVLSTTASNVSSTIRKNSSPLALLAIAGIGIYYYCQKETQGKPDSINSLNNRVEQQTTSDNNNIEILKIITQNFEKTISTQDKTIAAQAEIIQFQQAALKFLLNGNHKLAANASNVISSIKKESESMSTEEIERQLNNLQQGVTKLDEETGEELEPGFMDFIGNGGTPNP